MKQLETIEGGIRHIPQLYFQEMVFPFWILLRKPQDETDLYTLRQALLSHPGWLPLISHRLASPLREGVWLDLQTRPDDDVRNLILYFSPPDQVKLDRDATQFLYKLSYFLGDFQHPAGLMDEDSRKEADIRQRFAQNYFNTTEFLVKAYTSQRRRTGEAKVLHPLRVFLRVVSDIPYIPSAYRWIAYTSHLASLLHDADEELSDFSLREEDDEYIISYTTADQKTVSESLNLTDIEAYLLYLQIKAVSTPKEAQKLSEGEQSQAQFQSLKKIVRAIYEEFGPLAAYYTLLIKFADRFDNISTYWIFDFPDKDVADLKNKLWETIKFFTELEAMATNLQRKIGADDDLSFGQNFQSAVQFCYYLLLGGNYNEAFADDLAVFAGKDSIQDLLPLLRRTIYHPMGNFLIPTLNPPNQLRRVMYNVP